MHDASKVLLGQVPSSVKDITEFNSDPANFPAGLACRLHSSGGLHLSSGFKWAGISLGRSLSDTKKAMVVRTGLGVPLICHEEYAELVVGDLTFRAKTIGSAANAITITLMDGGTAGDEDVEVTGTDIVVNMDDGVSTAQQIADAIEASEEASELVSVSIAEGEEASAQADAAEDNLAGGVSAGDYTVIGEKAYIDDASGECNDPGETVTVSDAIIVSDPLVGVKEDGTEVAVVLVDMPGGL